ncbi:hypothetical protein [Rhodovarius sp.]|uniref:hypothetical protein n=1 Tax=Rhodovarius sp. TaxID=2972673 RepID=UPI00333F572A
MLTVYDAAVACNKIYSSDPTGGFQGIDANDGSRVREWTRVMRKRSVDDGEGKADAYWVYRKGDDVLFVIRGSDRGSDWTANNARIGVNVTPVKATDAFKSFTLWAKAMQGPKCNYYITGHSLGGGLAQLIGYYTGTPFIAFNPPPMRNSLTGWLTMRPTGAKDPAVKSWEFDKGCVFRGSRDAVSSLPGKFIGKSWMLPIGGSVFQSGLGVVDGHSMTRIIEAIENNSVSGISKNAPLSTYWGKAVD